MGVDLVTWLRSQLDADELTTCAATPGPWSATDNGCIKHEGPNEATYGSAWGTYVVASVGAYDGRKPNDADAAHIAEQNPVRVRRQVEAHRTIVDAVLRWSHYSCQDGWYSCSQATAANGFPVDEECADDDRRGQPCDCGLEQRRMAVLAPLASIYSDRPGYREEWAP